MKLMIAAAAAALAPAAQAQDAAQTGGYANLGYARADSQPGHIDAVQGKLGYRFMRFVGVEGELAVGIASNTVSVRTGVANPPTVKASMKLEHEVAGYMVGFFPLGANTDLIARLGYGSTKVSVKGPGIAPQTSHESVNYGIGFQHYFDGVNGIRLDWTRLDFNHGYGSHGDVLGVAYTRRF
jgi:opacity protein-like surface antigen